MKEGSHIIALKKRDVDLNNRVTLPSKPSIEEPPIFKLQALPSDLCYEFSEANNTSSIVIVTDLIDFQVKDLIPVLQKFKREIRWSTVDIIGILPKFSKQKI